MAYRRDPGLYLRERGLDPSDPRKGKRRKRKEEGGERSNGWRENTY